MKSRTKESTERSAKPYPREVSMKRIATLTLLALFSLGIATSCGSKTSKAEKRKIIKKYLRAAREVWNEENKAFSKTREKVKEFGRKKKDNKPIDKEMKKKFKKRISESLEKYKKFISKIEGLKASIKEVKQFKDLDVKYLKAKRDIVKHWKNACKEGKIPSLDKAYKELDKKSEKILDDRRSLFKKIKRKYKK